MPASPRTTNYSLYSLPVAYLLTMVPHVYLESSMIKAVGQWGNVSPRVNVERASARLSDATLAAFKRAQSAHANGLESLPIFGLAVLAANLADVDVETINKVSLLYIISRCIYNPVYIFGTSAKVALLRTLLWFTGQGASLWLLKSAAAQLAKSSQRLK